MIGIVLAVLVGIVSAVSAGDATDFSAKRAELVRELKRQGIEDEGVLAAIAAVPRHEFIPEEMRAHAYLNRPLPIGEGQTISQPYIVALMTELLNVRRGQKILEVGTGSGYQAAVLDHLGATVDSVEIVPELARRAARDLKRLDYVRVRVHEGDGFMGRAKEAPFDSVIVTCAIDRVPPPLIEQVKIGGRIVLPLGKTLHYQDLTVVTKQPDGELEYRNVTGVVFVPMVGPHGHREMEKGK